MKRNRGLSPFILVALLSTAGWCDAVETLPGQPLTAPPAPFAGRSAVDDIQTFVPEWAGREIIAGNKRLLMNQDGIVRFFADGREVGKFTLPFSLFDKRTGKDEWISTESNWPKNFFDLSKSGIIAEDGELVYRKTLVHEGKSTECVTTVRLRPDGKIAVAYRWRPFDSEDFVLNPRTVMFVVPPVLARGASFDLDRRRNTIPEGTEGKVWNQRDFRSLVLFPDTPGQSISLLSTALSGDALVDCRPDTVMFRIATQRDKNEVEVLVDITKGLSPKAQGSTMGGIDFKAIDALEVPDFKASRNLVQNSSFEQGLDCYWEQFLSHRFKGTDLWDRKIYLLDRTEVKFGAQSLKVLTGQKSKLDYRFFGYPFRTFPVALSAGRFTFSFYAKGEAGEEQRVSIWFPNVAWLGNRNPSLPVGWKSGSETGAQRVFEVTPEWQRYSFTFDVPESMPVAASIGAESTSGTSFVWLDGLQLEAGEGATPYAARPVEAKLVTSRPDNFLTPSDPVDARLDITAAPGVSGEVTVSVKDFFDKEWFRGTLPFTCNDEGRSVVSLPLNGQLPRGIFVAKAEYTVKDGQSTRSYHRFSIMDALANQHRLKALFAEDYQNNDSVRPNFREILERYRTIGLGGKCHTMLWNREIWEEYEKYGITVTDSVMYSLIAPYVGIHSSLKGFGMMRTPGLIGLSEKDARFLVRDYKLDANGELTDEYLEKFKGVAAMLAKENPWIPMWAFGVEIFSKFPVAWWSEDNSPESAYRNYAKLLKAFYQGVKEGNPKALVYQDTPSNMSPEGGIRQTGQLLAEVNKLGGVRFDMIGIHTYRKSPENPDFDSDTQTFFGVLAKNGYGDTPIFWPEGMHYGPYTIPKWGIESASWLPPSCWYYGTLSYDMGWTEKISAAWRARSWLVALKYQDRVKALMSGAFINNFEMDINLTPFATQKISNTLGRLLGNAYFKKDVRFAPYVRCYIFEDEQKRPVAAVWCHHPKLDAGTMIAPTVKARFGGNLGQIFDLMECERTFSPDEKGDVSFQASSFPLFFRGKTGTLDAFIRSFENATVTSGEGIAPLLVSAKPYAPDEVAVTAKNFLSREFTGELKSAGQAEPLKVPASGAATVKTKVPVTLTLDKISEEKLPVAVQSGESTFDFDLGFRGFLSPKSSAPIRVDGETGDWAAIQPIPITNRLLRDKKLKSVAGTDFSGWFKTAWTPDGLYLCVKIVDDKLTVKAFDRPAERWNNDSLQIYFDSFCDARSRQQQVSDENDYAYAIHVSATGEKSEVYRSRTPDPQLGLATQAPQDNTLAPDIPSAFKRTSDGYVYEVFFPAKYLLPIRLEKGSAIGIGLTVNDRDDEQGSAKSSLTLTPDGTDCYNHPSLWPAMLLWE